MTINSRYVPATAQSANRFALNYRGKMQAQAYDSRDNRAVIIVSALLACTVIVSIVSLVTVM